ncbi:MAG TPA: (d)CMP kinase [Candidatus Levybacteria bacterium]|nr:(d)CMP kinase [Candidatus Levybacteria bacterium]
MGIEQSKLTVMKLSEKPKGIDLLSPSYNVIELAGWAGTGTSSVGRALAEQHGAEFVDVGKIFKKIHYATTGNIVVGAIDRKPEIDDKLNALGRLVIRNATGVIHGRQRRPVIVDSRLGPIIALQQEMKEKKDLGILKIKLITTVEESARRIAKREGIDYKEVLEKTIERNKSDAGIFRKMLELNEESGDALDENLFDLIVDTTNTTINENIAIINNWLHKRGYLS